MIRYTILLVDDDYFVLNGIGKYLSNKGYDVMIADSGEKGLDLLDERHFHMVITDLAMERINGIGVLKKAKENSPETMVMILTGYGNLSSAIEAIRFGADDYILKPCEPLEMQSRVYRCFAKHEFALKIKSYENTLPVCSVCKKIRDDSGRQPGSGKWVELETYIQNKGGVDVTYSHCPECTRKAEQEVDRELERLGNPAVF